MFTQFNRQGHRMLSAEITQELQDLANRHGLDISAAGGQYGDTEFIIKIRVTTGDTSAVEAKKRAEIDRDGRWVGGLQGSDYGAIFPSNGERFRFTGVNPGRPRYPISGERVRDGRSFKFGQHIAQLIIAQRQTAPTPPIATAGQQQSPSITPPPANNNADDGALDAFATF
jgi:hypothetical protein